MEIVVDKRLASNKRYLAKAIQQKIYIIAKNWENILREESILRINPKNNGKDIDIHSLITYLGTLYIVGLKKSKHTTNKYRINPGKELENEQ